MTHLQRLGLQRLSKTYSFEILPISESQYRAEEEKAAFAGRVVDIRLNLIRSAHASKIREATRRNGRCLNISRPVLKRFWEEGQEESSTNWSTTG